MVGGETRHLVDGPINPKPLSPMSNQDDVITNQNISRDFDRTPEVDPGF